MVWTLKGASVTSGLSTDQSAAVWTGIQQHPDLAVIPSREDDRAAYNTPRAKVTRVWHFRLMTCIDPAVRKNALSFEYENRRVSERTTVNAKQTGFTIVNNYGV